MMECARGWRTVQEISVIGTKRTVLMRRRIAMAFKPCIAAAGLIRR